MINYLTPNYFQDNELQIKFDTIIRAADFCKIMPCTTVKELQSAFVLVDAMYFDKNENEDLLADLCYYGAFANILYFTDMTPLKWTGNFRRSVADFFSGNYNYITYNSHYQRCLLQALGYSDLRFLTDPIDTKLFVPLPKQLQVLACGKISCIKNSEFIRDLFVALQGIKEVTTVYIGGSDLWGDVAVSDIVLEQEIRLAADIFLSNIPHHEVAGYMGQASFFVANNIHELYSESHVESLSSGCVSICGGHPVYSERPGFYSKVLTVEQALSALDEYTNGFTTLPQDSLVESSRAWALENASYNAFNHQLQAILSEWF